MEILIIDDDPAMTDLLQIQLQTTEFGIKVAHSGAEGLKSTQKNKPDIIILDLLMPDMNGLDIFRELRRFTQSPILILSALDQPMMVANALDAGADDYLVKPVSSAMLIAHLQNLSRRIKANNRSISAAII